MKKDFKKYVVQKTLPFVAGVIVNAERLDLFNKLNRAKNIFFRRVLPMAGAVSGAGVVLTGCGASQQEINDLRQQVGILQSDNETQESLINTYLETIKDLEERNQSLWFENNSLYQKLYDAENKISILENSNLDSVQEDSETTVTEVEPSKHYSDYAVAGILVSPLDTEASEEMKETSYSASDLWIFDTTKLEEGDTSFDNSKDYRKYYILQHNSWYDEFRYTTFYYFSSFFNGSVDLNGKVYYNYFIGDISDTQNGYVATANHYDEISRVNGTYDTHISLANSNPVPFETYSHLNDFLIANNLESYVKDTYTEADLLEINLLLNSKDLDLGYSTGR